MSEAMGADASRVPAGGRLSRIGGLLRAKSGMTKRLRSMAGSRFQTLGDAEPTLRRTIPIMIVGFLAILAVARFISLGRAHV